MVVLRLLYPIALGCVLMVSPVYLYAQVPDSSLSPPDQEALLEYFEDIAGDAEQLAELLEELSSNPHDINSATAFELSQIPAFGPLLAYELVRFRDAYGDFNSLPEIRSVEGITEDVYIEARPYLTIGGSLQIARENPSRFPSFPSRAAFRNDLRVEFLQRVTRRLDVGRGYSSDTTRTTYAGSPTRVYSRFNARVRNHFSVNLTLEKDPGELFTWTPASQTYGFDHITAHASVQNMGRLRTLIIGDYVANFGQGVALWRNSSFGKGRDPVRPLVRFGKGLTPYGSTDENAFFRGIASSISITPELVISAFVSRRSLDANLLLPDTTDQDTPSPFSDASSLSISGLHRTPSEIEDKDAIKEDVLGGAVEYTFRSAKFGITQYHSAFNRPFQPGDAGYQQFLFSGTSASMTSVFATVFRGESLLFGELARTNTGVLGGTGGVMLRFGREADILLQGRHYPRDYVSLHGYAFGERNGATQNETGVYVGLRLRPSPSWLITAYADQYRFPWSRFGAPLPSTGHDLLFFSEYRPRRWISVYAQLRSETKETGAPFRDERGREFDALAPETRQSFRLHGDYQFSRSLRLRTRFEGIRFESTDRETTFGSLLFQEFRWLPLESLQVDTRLAFFDTESYGARVFAYENDLLYTFSIPSFSGRGQRFYVLVRWLPSAQISLQAKYGITQYEDARSVGSGLDEVNGNRVREFRIQLRMRF